MLRWSGKQCHLLLSGAAVLAVDVLFLASALASDLLVVFVVFVSFFSPFNIYLGN